MILIVACRIKLIDLQSGWQVNLAAGSITFKKKEEERTFIPTAKLISANLAYARELEQIV